MTLRPKSMIHSLRKFALVAMAFGVLASCSLIPPWYSKPQGVVRITTSAAAANRPAPILPINSLGEAQQRLRTELFEAEGYGSMDVAGSDPVQRLSIARAAAQRYAQRILATQVLAFEMEPGKSLREVLAASSTWTSEFEAALSAKTRFQFDRQDDVVTAKARLEGEDLFISLTRIPAIQTLDVFLPLSYDDSTRVVRSRRAARDRALLQARELAFEEILKTRTSGGPLSWRVSFDKALGARIKSYIDTIEPQQVAFAADDSCRLTLVVDRAVVIELLR